MPAYNSGRLIASGITSVLSQTRGDLELIVIDDGSTDDTAEKANSFRDDGRVHVVRQPNRGPSAARNTGLRIARGRFVTMLDSDDILLPRYLEVMGEALDRDATAGFAYTDAYVLDELSMRIRRPTMMAYQRPPRRPPPDPRSMFRLLLDRNFVCPTATVRRSVLDAVGGFDERLWRAEEWELWLRILHAGHGAIRPPGTLVVHRDRAGSLSTDLAKMIEGVLEVYRIVADEYGIREDVRDVTVRKRAFWQSYLARLLDPALPLTPTERAWKLARAVKRRVVAPWLWRNAPPADVTDTLRACGVLLDSP